MKIQFKNFGSISKIRKHSLSAVILAAGASERFGENKMAYRLLGIPVFVRTLMTFDASPFVSEIILVVKKEERDAVTEILSEYSITKLKKIVSGGDTRQESSLLGFEACDPKTEYVSIHDGARCLITEEMIEEVVRAAYRERAAAAAHKMTDTVKVVTKDGYVEKTLDRDYIYAVSTPQIFMADLYRAAAYTAKDAKFAATDDCMLAERVGFKVKLVEVGGDNIKITFKEDISRATEILNRREVEVKSSEAKK